MQHDGARRTKLRRMPATERGRGDLEDTLWAIFNDAFMHGDDAVAERVLATILGLMARRRAASGYRDLRPGDATEAPRREHQNGNGQPNRQGQR